MANKKEDIVEVTTVTKSSKQAPKEVQEKTGVTVVGETKKETVEIVKPTPKIAKPKYVKVLPKFSGKKFIGGTWYHFKKDKECEVTEDAKRVLREAGDIYL